MVNKVIGTVLMITAAGCHPVFADAPCSYDKTVETNWTQQIEKTSNLDKKVFPYVDDTRKCIMTMDVTIGGQTYPTEGSYVFGPDMSENNACEQATINAKKSVISKVSPEILTAKTEMNCSTKETMPVVVASPQPNSKIENREVIIQEGIPVVTERIISRKVIDNTHNNSVLYIPRQHSTFSAGGVTIGFSNGKQSSSCYANWKTGGTDCY